MSVNFVTFHKLDAFHLYIMQSGYKSSPPEGELDHYYSRHFETESANFGKSIPFFLRYEKNSAGEYVP